MLLLVYYSANISASVSASISASISAIISASISGIYLKKLVAIVHCLLGLSLVYLSMIVLIEGCLTPP